MTATHVADVVIRIGIYLEQATTAPTLTVVTTPDQPAAEQDAPAPDIAEAPAATVASLPTDQGIKLGPAQREILTWLADNGGHIVDDTGAATTTLADEIGKAGNHASGLCKALTARGLIERDVRGKRTYRIAITPLGRQALGRNARWAAPHQPVTATERATPSAPTHAPPPMPDAGPIGRHRFDPDAARQGAAKAAF